MVAHELVIKWLKKYYKYEVDDLFYLAYRVVYKTLTKKDVARVDRDLYNWEDHLFVPRYVIRYIAGRQLIGRKS